MGPARSPIRTRSGRHTVVRVQAESSERLRRFIARPRHAQRFVRMDLSLVAAHQLEDASLHRLLGGLPSLKQVVVPFEGWSSVFLRKEFLLALPAGTSFVCVSPRGQILLSGLVDR